MPQLNLLFKIATAIALIGWCLLIFVPGWTQTAMLVSGAVAGLLAGLYGYLVLVARRLDTQPVRGSFTSLRGIVSLFQSPRIVLAGWVHFLAFDLMVALWIRADAAPLAIAHGWLVPVYLLTLMFGPLGLLAYFLLRFLLA